MEPAAHLKEVFGYDCFLPNQEEIVGQILAGRDVFDYPGIAAPQQESIFHR